ncbi:hypothetical protein CUMW_179060 [Citrus unshiu]|uniref:Uncharacterized protein n=1 Tax=Citrus unshiu TaxID=55188 RepID=A0A2H5PYH6_CITUN|nr:hypothetical protein CUMW_179060 [Citrus unshiu]
MGAIIRKFRGRNDKRRLMMRNGTSVLKELIASSNGKYNPCRIFAAKELEIATNNYDEKSYKTGSIYKLYEGFWQESLISVMKFYGHEYHICSTNEPQSYFKANWMLLRDSNSHSSF